MVASSELPLPSIGELTIIGVLAACAAYIITIAISRSAYRLNGIDSRKINLAVILFVIGLSILMTGWFSAIVLVLAIALGLVPQIVNVSRVYCMGAIMVPVMLYFFGSAWV